LFFSFPEDETVYKDDVLDNQIMIGDYLLIIPNTNNEENRDNLNTNYNQQFDTIEDHNKYFIDAYFPEGDWYDLRSEENIFVKKNYSALSSKIYAPLKEIVPVFLRGGKIIFTNTIDESVKNSYDLNSVFNLFIGLDSKDLTAEGYLVALNNYNKKNEVEFCLLNDCFIPIKSENNSNKLSINFIFSNLKFINEEFKTFELQKLKIFGFISGIKNILIEFVTKNKDNINNQVKENKILLGNYELKIFNYFTHEINFTNNIKIDLSKYLNFNQVNHMYENNNLDYIIIVIEYGCVDC